MLYYEGIELNRTLRSKDYTLDKEGIMAFAGQWDPQPFHTDEEAAAQWPLGLTASSVHSYAISSKLATTMSDNWPAVVAALGVDDMRMPSPARPGDTLHVESYIESKRESSSKPNMGIITAVTQLINQRGEMVLSYKTSSLILKEPVAGEC